MGGLRDKRLRGTVFCCTQNTFYYVAHSVELGVLVGGGGGVGGLHYILSLVCYILLYTEHILCVFFGGGGGVGGPMRRIYMRIFMYIR